MANKKIQRLNFIIFTACLCGVILSIYTLYIEKKLQHDEDYSAFCDITSEMSCSKVLKSRYSRGLGLIEATNPLSLPNGLYGVIFYTFLGFLTTSDNPYITRMQLLLTIASMGMTVYLAYVLYAVLRDFCIVCIGTYIVNIICFGCTYTKYKEIKGEEEFTDESCTCF